MSEAGKPMTARQYRALADFRYAVRRYLRYSEELTRRHGMTPLQYQMMLPVRGRGPLTVGELAERLQARHHGVVALVTRCARAGLVARRPSTVDRRAVLVELTPRGTEALEQLARLHRNELLAGQGRLVVPDLENME